MVATYLLLVTIALLILVVISPSQIGFAGVYIIILTMPWSLFSTEMLISLGLMDTISMSAEIVIFIGEAILNGFILYLIGSKYDRARKNGS
ncbi:MAG: SCO4225 family membrane protein [Thermodesulfovibrionales bacterium]